MGKKDKTPLSRRFGFYSILSLVAIVFLVFMRFYKAVDFFTFNFDEEYQALLAFEQVKHFHRIWIGVSASNIGFYLGPGFTYLNAFLFKLTHGDPVSIAYFAPLLGVLTGFSIYFVSKEIFSKKAATLATIFYLGSSLMNFLDRRFWNPLPIPFITIWLFYFLYKVQKDTRYFIGVSFLLAASLHVHLSLLVFWPVVLFYAIKNIKKISLKTWISCIGVYLIVISPLIVFDFVHNFDNISTPLRYIQNKNIEHQKITGATINSHWAVWMDSLSRYLYISPYTDLQNEQCLGQHCTITPGNKLIGFISLLALAYLIYGALRDRNKQYLLLMIAFSMIFFILYPGYSAEYYLLNFFVLFPIVLALLFDVIPTPITVLILAIFILFNSFTVLNSSQAKYGLTVRKAAIKKVMTVVGNKPYSLENYGVDPRKYHPYGGWRYLFKIYGKTPVQSFADEYFGWIYQKEMTNEKPVYRVVVSDSVPYHSQSQPIAQFQQGTYYFYVYNVNSQL
ncbi:MAG: glycosyltransferase family 39 protein [Candidatus Roizmanbacteria bacterium]|nr:glycosyltransferase family 39 protein [Candidatus Roizmanbacteria bacterium]